MQFQKADFNRILATHQITLSDAQERRFALYCSMLQEWSQRMNLTAILEENAIYEKHFLDSILPLLQLPLQGHLCDVGSGAGFPSLPMKLVMPSLKVTIIEPIQKRITFLSALCEALSLEGVTLIHGRSEDFARKQRECFDIVTARAVAPLPILAELCIPLVKQGGIFLAMKGANGEAEHTQAAAGIARLGCTYRTAMYHTLSDDAKRITLVYDKDKKTPLKYPRPYAQMKKHPL